MKTLIECVPNFSEGRRADVVRALVLAAGSVDAARVLDVSSDPDHNRTVITIFGPPDPVAAAALAAAAAACAHVDMREHGGVHPCIGAVDVVPFIPLKGGSLAVCAALGRYFARRLWERLRVPSYYYGAAAAPDRTRALVELRRGGFRGLTARMLHDRPPDAGEGPPHPTAGAAIVGARPVLVAFNVNLATEDAGIARAIARRVRESSGGVPGIQAMGVPLPSRGLAQVSMNLYDLSAVTPRTAFDAVRREADRLGVGIVESEIVGLSPAFALTETDARAIRLTAPAGEKSLDAALGRSIGCHEGVA